MDGRHKTIDRMKKKCLEAPKCAQPLSVRKNPAFKFFQLANLHTLHQQEGAEAGSVN